MKVLAQLVVCDGAVSSALSLFLGCYPFPTKIFVCSDCQVVSHKSNSGGKQTRSDETQHAISGRFEMFRHRAEHTHAELAGPLQQR